ncbi:hypothetical protein NC653_024047 [Populus alba x Populus x berolinensis]|uniref:Uncharacterized protein n=1 Tax=Populus alba x Populus x berolinensis TaxID=444605 RepID=A0AAD6MJF4_9ROSI|nr:hypothetical protein NC653_024047 [Populus alba x Populus x berolinensis]
MVLVCGCGGEGWLCSSSDASSSPLEVSSSSELEAEGGSSTGGARFGAIEKQRGVGTRKGDDLGATYSHYFDRERKFAAAAKITRRFSIKENIVMVGGSWNMDHRTTIKSRFDNLGNLATLIEYEIKPKSNLTISTVFNAESLDTFPGIGLILSLVL